MWSFGDDKYILDLVDLQFADNIEAHIKKDIHNDLFHGHVIADPKGHRSKVPQNQEPYM